MALILKNARLLYLSGQAKINQSIVIDQDKISWCGDDDALPECFATPNDTIENCHGDLITPGLIDCHTHLVYAGDRSHEFKLRLQGLSYKDIAQQGGGILSTVLQTRSASEEELLQQSLPRLMALCKEGVTTVEIKSGYGLNTETELKLLRVAKQLGHLTGIRVKTTFLGAHALPPEFAHRQEQYVDYVCQEMMPAIAEAKLADYVDVFCEDIAFSLAQTERLFLKAQELNLPIKCHAEQLSNIGASQLAAHMQALSCDHLEYLDEPGATAMAKNQVVAVLLPGAFYFLKETQCPPIDLLRQKNIKIAIATDANPGSSPTTSLLLMASMACRFFSLTVPEVLQGITCHAAAALGMANQIGTIAPGFHADLVRWHVPDEAALCYYFSYPLTHQTMIAGQWLS